MRLSIITQLLGFCSIIGILSCNGPETTPKLSVEKNPIEEIKYNDKYEDLLDTAERMRVYIKEEHTTRSIVDFEGDTEECIKIKEKEREHQIKFANELYNLTLKLARGELVLDAYIYNLLTSRLKYLIGRDDAIYNRLSLDNEIPLIIPPTSKPLFNWLFQSGPLSSHIHQQESLRISAITRFEILNLLIKKSFLACSLDELQPETINLLRASVQLHPILTNPNQHLGLPDEACSWYGILETILIPTESCHNKFPLLFNVKTELEQELRKMNVDPDKNRLALLRTLIEAVKKEVWQGSKLKNELLELRRDRDACVYAAHFKKFIRFMGLGTPRGQGIHVYEYDPKNYKQNNWPYSFPNPDFLRLALKKDAELPTIGNVADKADEQESRLTETSKKKKKKRNKKRSHKQKKPIARQEDTHLSRSYSSNDLTVHEEYMESDQENIQMPPSNSEEEFGGVTLILQEREKEKEKEEEASIKDDLDNYQHLFKFASQGDPEAQFRLGERAYNLWKEMRQRSAYKEAKEWLEKGAFQGHQGAIVLLEQIRLFKIQKERDKSLDFIEEIPDVRKFVGKIHPTSGQTEQKKRVQHKKYNIHQASSMPIANSKAKNAVEPQTPTQWLFERDWVLPKGLRMFHRWMFSIKYPIHLAGNNGIQSIIDRLLDPQQQHTVTFREFKNAWVSEKGEIIENKGGSHKELIGPRGDKLFGIFAHGNNQTYGPRYIEYLQTAILYIGLRPTYKFPQHK